MISAAVVGLGAAALARADVWGYVDEGGAAHVANERLDGRYQLFFKGSVAPEPAAAEPEATSPGAPDAVVHTAAFQRVANAGNTTRYGTLIEKHAASHDVDPALVKAIVAVESGFEPGAVSPKGARGLMQVMPQTAARYGVTDDRKRSAEQKLLDPAVNLQVGTRYLRDLLARFANDLSLTLAAYNAGEMAVERYKNRVPPYPETIAYVKRVREFYAAFRPVATTEKVAAQPGIEVQRRVRGTFLARPARMEADAPVL